MRVLPKPEVHRAAIIFGGRGAALPDGGPYKYDECHHSPKRVSTSRPLPFQHDYFTQCCAAVVLWYAKMDATPCCATKPTRLTERQHVGVQAYLGYAMVSQCMKARLRFSARYRATPCISTPCMADDGDRKRINTCRMRASRSGTTKRWVQLTVQ